MIFYFSGTGNTKWAATILAEATNDKLVSISEAVNGDAHYALDYNERIGFCFPVHGWRPPILVRNFIKQLTFDNYNNNYCYALCTAGDNIGETMDFFQKDLAEIGLHAMSTFSLIMPESYVGLPFMDVDTDEKEKLKISNASVELQEYKKYICDRCIGINKLVKGNWPKTNSYLIGGFFLTQLITDKPFHVTSDKCIQCGMCANVCPVKDITGGKGSEPTWNHNGKCLTCFSCYHHCPTHAIEFGGRTKHKGQYFFKHKL